MTPPWNDRPHQRDMDFVLFNMGRRKPTGQEGMLSRIDGGYIIAALLIGGMILSLLLPIAIQIIGGPASTDGPEARGWGVPINARASARREHIRGKKKLLHFFPDMVADTLPDSFLNSPEIFSIILGHFPRHFPLIATSFFRDQDLRPIQPNRAGRVIALGRPRTLRSACLGCFEAKGPSGLNGLTLPSARRGAVYSGKTTVGVGRWAVRADLVNPT